MIPKAHTEAFNFSNINIYCNISNAERFERI